MGSLVVHPRGKYTKQYQSKELPIMRWCLICLLAMVALSLTGCDMFGEYEMRKQASKARMAGGGAVPAAAQPAQPGQPADPNAGS